ncbi:hypothetical protein [Dysgonomonas massiliensis]|uniref:hypothetical protein n=1 Tax=Dysgonomonas massiliensis TaxID=2040292 RepID=UPI0013576B63|nr:hypothetical protein [Dysgonomonas massiliensis]
MKAKVKFSHLIYAILLFVAVGLAVDSYGEMKAEKERYENSTVAWLDDVIKI